MRELRPLFWLRRSTYTDMGAPIEFNVSISALVAGRI